MLAAPTYTLARPAGHGHCTADDEWYDECRADWMCTRCGGFRTEPGVVDVRIQETRPAEILTFVWGTQLGVARRAVLQALGVEHSPMLQIGRVIGGKGDVLPEWVSFHGIHGIVVRGCHDVILRRCPECHRALYFATGRKYLCPAPDPVAQVLDAGKGSLVIRNSPDQPFPGLTWKGVSIVGVPVRTAPLDGLPVELPGRAGTR